jgi:hypothetical protein
MRHPYEPTAGVVVGAVTVVGSAVYETAREIVREKSP